MQSMPDLNPNEKLPPIEYEVIGADDLNQYPDHDFSEDKIVYAKYIKNLNYPGNHLIEALPKAIRKNRLSDLYTVLPIVPSIDDLENMEEDEVDENIEMQLDKVRFILPFHLALEQQFRTALVSTYSRRHYEVSLKRENNPIVGKYVAGDTSCELSAVLEPNEKANPPTGFHLLGLSGCGKSTSISTVLSHYPQTIYHFAGTWKLRPQILYLYVQCAPNSNFIQLYSSLGEAIDEALGNKDKYYQKMFNSQPDLAHRYEVLKDQVKKLGIGIILLDEIELMDLNANKPGTYNTFMTLENDTGVAMGIIGTQETYSKMFPNYSDKLIRRFGMHIPAGSYCKNFEEFKDIFMFLSISQWGSYVEYSDGCIEKLFELTNGVIYDLISFYKLIQKNQVRAFYDPDFELPDMTPEYLEELITDAYGSLIEARKKVNKLDSSLKMKEIENQIAELASKDAAAAKKLASSERYARQIMKDDHYKQYMLLRRDVLEMVKLMMPRKTEKTILKAFMIAVPPEYARDISYDVETACDTVIGYFNDRQEKAKQRRSNKEKIDIQAMQNELLEADFFS